jgi:hypothetical protein
MYQFSKDHVIILPHAEEYRKAYNIGLDEVVLTLNEPDLHEGLTNDKYTVEKTISKKHIYIYYYQTFPLQGNPDELYAIVDFVSVTDEAEKK